MISTLARAETVGMAKKRALSVHSGALARVTAETLFTGRCTLHCPLPHCRWGGKGEGHGLLLLPGKLFFLPFDLHNGVCGSMSRIGLAEAGYLGNTRTRSRQCRWQPRA